MMKNTKKGKVWGTIFYSFTIALTYVGFVGIEAKASSISNFENKILSMGKPTYIEKVKNITSKKTDSTTNYKFVKQDSIKQKTKIYYKKDGFYTSFIEINNEKLNYVVDGNKKITFYNSKGNVVKVNKENFELVDLLSDELSYYSSSHSVRFFGIDDEDKYTRIAEPLVIDKKQFTKDFTDIILKKIPKTTEKKRYDLIVTFDIDVDGNVINVQNLSTTEIYVEEDIKKFLYSQQRWQPSEIDGDKVLSTYKIHFLSRINYSIKEMGEEDNNEKTPQS